MYLIILINACLQTEDPIYIRQMVQFPIVQVNPTFMMFKFCLSHPSSAKALGSRS
jgi:hypothetical protein